MSSFRAVHPTLLGVLLLAATACATGDDGSVDASDDGDALTVEHIYGTTEIPGVPADVVSLDHQWTDTLLALGIQPVAYAVDTSMPDSEVPWQEHSDEAEALAMTDGIPFDRIAELNPDLILGTYSIPDDEAYGLLSEIAPTVPNLEDDLQVIPWQELVTTAGEIFDESTAAQSVIDSVEGEIADTVTEFPELEDQTFLLAQYVVGDAMYLVADENDGSSQFFRELGMGLYPPVVTEGGEAGEPRLNVSTERSDLLEADLLVFLVNGGTEDDLVDIPGFDELPGTVALLDYATIVALNTPTPLSIPHAVEQLRPHLEDAASAAS